MKSKGCFLFLLIITLSWISCDNRSDPAASRIFVVQQVILDDGRYLFWFRDQEKGTDDVVSYFQITDDPCELSVSKAHVRCRLPVQINNFFGDRIFIVTQTPLEVMRTDVMFSFKAIKYSPESIDHNKKPDIHKQFFLDSICPTR